MKGKKSIKRTPVKAKVVRTPVKDAKVKLRVDPLKEYAEAIKSSGVMEVLTLSDDDSSANVRMFHSSQSLALDRLLGGGGFPAGRITEITGPNHIGKSALLDQTFAGVQRIGGVAVLADSENARDKTFTAKLGVDISKLQYLEFEQQQQSMEEILMAFFRTIDFWATKYPDTPVVIGWDSLGGTSTQEELAKDLSQATMASAAKVLRKTMRQITHRLANTKIALVVLNHNYKKVQGRGGNESYGGEAIRHAASVRLELHSVEAGWITRADGAVIGRKVGVKLHKSRFGNSFGDTEFVVLNDIGIDNTWTLHSDLVASGHIVTSGNSGWGAVNIDGEVLKFQGWNGFQAKLQEHPEVFNKLVSIYLTLPKG